MNLTIPVPKGATNIEVQNVWNNKLRNAITVGGTYGSFAAFVGIAAFALPADLAKQDYWLGLGVALIGLIGMALIYGSHHFAVRYPGPKGAWRFFLATMLIIVIFGGIDLVLVFAPHYAFKAYWPMLNGVWSGLILTGVTIIWILLMRGASRFKNI